MLHLSVCSGRAPFRSFMFALHACYVISIALVLFVKLHGLEEEPGKLLLSPLTHKLWLLSQCDTKSRPASSRASSYFCQGKIFARISIPELEMGKCVSFLDARCASIAGTGTKENLSFWEKLTFLYFFFLYFFLGGGAALILAVRWHGSTGLSYLTSPNPNELCIHLDWTLWLIVPQSETQRKPKKHVVHTFHSRHIQESSLLQF